MLERSILGWVVIGLIVGLSAKLLLRGRDPGGMIVSVMIGIAGALLAGFVAQGLGLGTGNGQFGVVAAGAAALLVVYRITLARRLR